MTHLAFGCSTFREFGKTQVWVYVEGDELDRIYPLGMYRDPDRAEAVVFDLAHSAAKRQNAKFVDEALKDKEFAPIAFSSAQEDVIALMVRNALEVSTQPIAGTSNVTVGKWDFDRVYLVRFSTPIGPG